MAQKNSQIKGVQQQICKVNLLPYKTVRLAVSGDISLNEIEIKIIDTRDFQRLRNIKNLGSTYLVYPTAVHTRFDHSLGTLHMAQIMLKSIRENQESTGIISDEEEQLIRLLALLHDITHIPFGHTLEDEFCIFDRHDEDPDRIDRFIGDHSKIGKIIIENFGKEFYERLIRLLTANKLNMHELQDDLFIYELVNNTVCADLLDYLRRDCHFCNIAFDMDYRFLKYLYLHAENDIRRVAIRIWKEKASRPRQDILSELVRLMDNRYSLGERVYFHHTKLISGAMIAGAVYRAVKKKKLKKEDLYELGDDSLLNKLESTNDKSITKLISALKQRKLWKRLYEKSLKDVESEQSKVEKTNILEQVKNRWWKQAAIRLSDEDFLSNLVGFESGDILIHCPNPNMAMKVAEMNIFWQGSLIPFHKCSDEIVQNKLNTILKSHESLWKLQVFINPDKLKSESLAKSGCEQLFCFEENDKMKLKEIFYKNIVETIITANPSYSKLPFSTLKELLKKAVDTIILKEAKVRNRKEIINIVNEAIVEYEPIQYDVFSKT